MAAVEDGSAAAAGPWVSTSTQRYVRIAQVLLSRLPLMVRTAVLHALNLSATAPYLDLRSSLTVAVLRCSG
ncbi:hypothetical protein CDD83_489 [Cordyceps sp. RAO-2017]|nr:hypothetical protein CDD83_489 [Cordyceps sp. RAO-2017]